MKNQRGFTIIELLIVIVIISLLSLLVVQNFRNPREEVLYARAQAEFTTMHKAIEIYRIYKGTYPSDVNRNIPPGIEPWLATNEGDHWPDAPWEGSVYDYDAFISGGEPTYQISIRYCPIGEPQNCNFPKTEWATDFEVNSSLYYCIYGNCKAHPNEAVDYPGYCANCDDSQGWLKPSKPRSLFASLQ
jgi:general secretion pathway protein G